MEVDKKHAEIARESFRRAGVADRVELLLGPALEQLPRLSGQGPFDLVFIDADKVNYPHYLDWAAENLRMGGAVLADNTLAWGMIADASFPSSDDETAVKSLRQFNTSAARGESRFRATLLPTGEGLTLAVKIR